jgi:hypothetical protein
VRGRIKYREDMMEDVAVRPGMLSVQPEIAGMGEIALGLPSFHEEEQDRERERRVLWWSRKGMKEEDQVERVI